MRGMKKVSTPALWAIALVASAPLAGAAIQVTLDRRAIEEAMYIGQSRIEVERTRFHAAYRVTVARPPVDWIDVITPFHRVALAAEVHARQGGGMFAQRHALEVLQQAPNQLDLLIEMSFHPLNTYVGMPSYDVALLGPGGTRAAPRRLDRYPRFGPRPESAGPALPAPNAAPVVGLGEPVLGGTLIAAFDASTLDAKGRYEVVVLEGTNELARAGMDFGTMR